jgi:dolichol-phosphate mannosyltransferase
VQGWSSVLATVLFLGSVQLISLGLLGEYLGRLYAKVQGRPAYFIGYDSLSEIEPRRSTTPGTSPDEPMSPPMTAAPP